jgi:hypothetical protein
MNCSRCRPSVISKTHKAPASHAGAFALRYRNLQSEGLLTICPVASHIDKLLQRPGDFSFLVGINQLTLVAFRANALRQESRGFFIRCPLHIVTIWVVTFKSCLFNCGHDFLPTPESIFNHSPSIAQLPLCTFPRLAEGTVFLVAPVGIIAAQPFRGSVLMYVDAPGSRVPSCNQNPCHG